MMNVRTQGTVLIAVGIVIFAGCMLADAIGIGANPTVVGWKQYFGATLGLMIAFLGAHLAYHHVERK